MARGYLASWNNIPPLVFRFQYNPSILQEKKSYKYKEVEESGPWRFDKTSAAANATDTAWYAKLVTTPAAVYDDLKELGPVLLQTQPLIAENGEQRTFAIDFALDSQESGTGITAETANPYGGTIEPDLAILRSFMVPSLDAVGLVKWIGSSGDGERKIFQPPQCTLVYGGLNVDCVMESLNIKVIAFNEDHTPRRAEIGVTLKQQTKSVTPLIETITRLVDVGKSYKRKGFGEDYLNVLPGISAVRHIFEL